MLKQLSQPTLPHPYPWLLHLLLSSMGAREARSERGEKREERSEKRRTLGRMTKTVA